MTSESARQEQTEIVPFEPTDKMLEYLDTAIEHMTTSPTKIARESSVGRTTYYDWLYNVSGFEDWFWKEYKKRRKRFVRKLDEIGMKKADEDFRYWEAMNKKVGDLSENSGTVVNVQTNVANVDPEEMEEFVKFREQKRRKSLEGKQ